MKSKVPVATLAVLAASLPAFANTASDNIAWSAKPVAAVRTRAECAANSGRPAFFGVSQTKTTVEPSVKTPETNGTAAAVTTLVWAAVKAGTATPPQPCWAF